MPPGVRLRGDRFEIRYAHRGKSFREMLDRGQTVTDAKDLLTQRKEELRSGAFVAPSDITFGVYARSWLEKGKTSGRFASQTYRGFDCLLRNQLENRIGGTPMQELAEPLRGSAYLSEVLLDLSVRGSVRTDDDGVHLPLGDERIKHARKMLSMIFNDAEREGIVLTNPMRHARLPKRLTEFIDVDREEPALKALTREQLQTLINAAWERTEWLFLLLGIVLGGICGLRIAEALAVRAIDFDATKRTVSVRQSIEPHLDSEAPKGKRLQLRLKPPKTQRSRRTIEVPAIVFEALALHLRDVRKDGHPIGRALVITRPDGKPWSPDAFGKRFGELADELGLDITFHGLRHTCATLLLEDGVDVMAVSEYLGHHSPAFTLARYSHATKKGRERVRESMTRMFGVG